MIDVAWMQAGAAGVIIGGSVASIAWTFIARKVQDDLTDYHTKEMFDASKALGNLMTSRNELADILVERDDEIKKLRSEVKFLASVNEQKITTEASLIAMNDDKFEQINRLKKQLVPLQEADARMRQQRAEAGRKGNAVANERRREKRKAAVAKTMAELGGTVSKMRSHAQVVAQVKALRTKAKKAQAEGKTLRRRVKKAQATASA